MNRIEEAIQKAKALARARGEEPGLGANGDDAVPLPPPIAPASPGWSGHDRRRHARAPIPNDRRAPERGLHDRSSRHAAEPRLPIEPPIVPESAFRSLPIDRQALQSVGIWPTEANERRLADEFRVAKRAVLGQFAKMRHVGHRRVVAVASALPGEGKTFSSFHLALSLALERELNVLLIDGDVARPTLSRAMGLHGAFGLLNCLDGATTALDEALYRTDVDRLWFMPAGQSTHTASELLSSPRMPVLLDAVSGRIGHAVIVIDTPPLLPTVESRALTDVADQVLVVVKANSTPEGAVLQAVEQLGEAKPVQLLLNQRRESKLDAYQYYYHAYPSPEAAHARAD